jgi:hypothetical protein
VKSSNAKTDNEMDDDRKIKNKLFLNSKDGRYFEEITKSDETHPKVERF